MVFMMVAQIVVMYLQKKWGPRWFAPKSWRVNSNAYLYYRTMKNSEIEDEELGNKQEDICVICMNAVRFSVDESGAVIPQAPGATK